MKPSTCPHCGNAFDALTFGTEEHAHVSSARRPKSQSHRKCAGLRKAFGFVTKCILITAIGFFFLTGEPLSLAFGCFAAIAALAAIHRVRQLESERFVGQERELFEAYTELHRAFRHREVEWSQLQDCIQCAILIERPTDYNDCGTQRTAAGRANPCLG